MQIRKVAVTLRRLWKIKSVALSSKIRFSATSLVDDLISSRLNGSMMNLPDNFIVKSSIVDAVNDGYQCQEAMIEKTVDY